MENKDAGDRILHPIKYSTLKEEEIPRKINTNDIRIQDFGDRIIRPIEYSTYHEEETEPL